MSTAADDDAGGAKTNSLAKSNSFAKSSAAEVAAATAADVFGACGNAVANSLEE